MYYLTAGLWLTNYGGVQCSGGTSCQTEALPVHKKGQEKSGFQDCLLDGNTSPFLGEIRQFPDRSKTAFPNGPPTHTYEHTHTHTHTKLS